MAKRIHERQQLVAERNALFFEAEAVKLDSWADDLKVSIERDIKDIDRQIKEARRASVMAITLQDKLVAQKQVRELEKQRNQRRRSLFDAQDKIDTERDDLIRELEERLSQRVSVQRLFTVRWTLR